MNVKRKQAIDTLSAAVSNINDVKIQTDIQSLGELSEAFINTSDTVALFFMGESR